MSIVCDLIEIPFNLVDILIKYRQLMTLYYRTSNSRENVNIGNILKLSQTEKEIIQQIIKLYPNRKKEIKQTWNLDNCKWILLYQEHYFEEYPFTKEYLPEIIKNARSCYNLYLGKSWALISFLFCGTVVPEASDLVIWNKSCIGLNVLFYKKNFLYSNDTNQYYLTIYEVKKIAELMVDFADEIIAENLKELPHKYKSLYYWRNYRLDYSGYGDFVKNSKAMCNQVKDFYYKVAERRNCIVISIY